MLREKRVRGTSLVEVLVYLAVFSLISTLVLGLVFNSMNLDRRLTRRIDVLRGVRLAQFTLMRTLITLGDTSMPPYKLSLSDTAYQPPRPGCQFDPTDRTSNCLMILKTDDEDFWIAPSAYSGPSYWTLYFENTGQIDPGTLEPMTRLMCDPGTPGDDTDDFPIIVSHHSMRVENAYVAVVPGLTNIKFSIASTSLTYSGKVVIFDIVVERSAAMPGEPLRMRLRSLTSAYSAF